MKRAYSKKFATKEEADKFALELGALGKKDLAYYFSGKAHYVMWN